MKSKFPDYYDEPKYDYRHYWDSREYEDKIERSTLKKLLTKIPREKTIVDLGCGFGRLAQTYANIFSQCYLVDPSEKMLRQARTFCQKIGNLRIEKGSLAKIPLGDQSVDVALTVRTLHHLADIRPALIEIARILKPGGFLILEYPNKMHLKNIVRNLVSAKRSFFSLKPENIARGNKVPFYNYHPRYVQQLLSEYGLEIKNKVSVSNFRSPFLKKVFSTEILLLAERLIRPLASALNTGPSIFVLAKKHEASKSKN